MVVWKGFVGVGFCVNDGVGYGCVGCGFGGGLEYWVYWCVVSGW